MRALPAYPALVGHSASAVDCRILSHRPPSPSSYENQLTETIKVVLTETLKPDML